MRKRPRNNIEREREREIQRGRGCPMSGRGGREESMQGSFEDDDAGLK